MVLWIDDDAYLTAAETCELLGIKRQTLYAYVSRGVLRSFRQGIRRQRLYLGREVDALRRLAPGSRPGLRRRRRAPTPVPHAEEWVGIV